MKKYLAYFILGVFLCIYGVKSTIAHPLDISSTVFSMGDSSLAGTTYFHTYEVGILLGKQGKDVSEIGLYNNYKEEIISYFRENIEIRNRGEACILDTIEIPDAEGYEILSRGVEIRYISICSESIEDLDIRLSFFTEYALQTNRLSIMDRAGKEVLFKVLTPQVQSVQYRPGQESVIRQDRDKDGIDDEEELVYKTNPEIYDTDGDFYSDGEEINHGWNPLDRNMSPGQSERESLPDNQVLSIPRDSIQQSHGDYSLVASGQGSSLFEDVLRRIGLTVSGEEKTAFPIIFVFTVMLGFLHALGPGHAKGLLSSIMIHKKSSFSSGMKFISIFSITHILDIFLLFLILRFFMQVFDASLLLSWIQQISAVLLLGLGSYLVYRSFLGKQVESDSEFTDGKITFLAIIAGLAPCSFGWSLFFMLISLGKIAWIPPLIFAIALGIFLCLFLILVTLTYSKKYTYSRIHILSNYSVRLSALLIFTIGIIFTKINFGL